jgi:hypothetical protein
MANLKQSRFQPLSEQGKFTDICLDQGFHERD